MARIIKGTVVSTKMDKTAVIAVDRVKIHPLYLKHITRTNRLKIHDEKNELQEGDLVAARETKPISKNKAFELVEVLDESDRITEEDEAEALEEGA